MRGPSVCSGSGRSRNDKHTVFPSVSQPQPGVLTRACRFLSQGTQRTAVLPEPGLSRVQPPPAQSLHDHPLDGAERNPCGPGEEYTMHFGILCEGRPGPSPVFHLSVPSRHKNNKLKRTDSFLLTQPHQPPSCSRCCPSPAPWHTCTVLSPGTLPQSFCLAGF